MLNPVPAGAAAALAVVPAVNDATASDEAASRGPFPALVLATALFIVRRLGSRLPVDVSQWMSDTVIVVTLG